MSPQRCRWILFFTYRYIGSAVTRPFRQTFAITYHNIVSSREFTEAYGSILSLDNSTKLLRVYKSAPRTLLSPILYTSRLHSFTRPPNIHHELPMSVNHYYTFANCPAPPAPASDAPPPDPNAWMFGAPAPVAPAAGPPPPQAPEAADPPPQWLAIVPSGNPPAPAPAPVVPQILAPPPASPTPTPAPAAGPDWFVTPAQCGFQPPAPAAAPQNPAGFYM